MNKNILEIAIPTYNRTIQLKKCLYSILIATRLLSQSEKKNIGIAINDSNSTSLISICIADWFYIGFVFHRRCARGENE